MNEMPALALDPSTLLFSISALGFLAAALSLGSSRRIGAQRYGLVEWTKAMLAVGASFLLFFLRGRIPEIFSFVLANGLFLAAPAYAYLAHARFSSIRPPTRLIGTLYAFGSSGVLLHSLLGYPREVAIASLSAAGATLFAMTAMLVLRHERWRGAPARIAVSGMALLSAVFALRALAALAGAGPSVGLTAQALPQLVALVGGSVAIASASVGFLLMVQDRQHQEALESSRRDGLTGLYTRSAFFESVAALEATPATRFSLVMVDIDHFKAINDSHGHTGGDVVLAHAGALILRSIRSADVAGRFGGEEFCIALRDCGQPEARHFAERLVAEATRQRVRLSSGAEAHFSVSVGYSSRRAATTPGQDCEPASTVLERADTALYEAKRAGRNRAVSADDARGPDTAVVPACAERATAVQRFAG